MSAILSADDLNDFISPGLACIKPVETLPQKGTASSDNPYEVTTEDKVQPENQAPTQISLTDCLACSGCVTSAEAVLISLQSHAEVLNTLDAHPPASLVVTDDGNISVPHGLGKDEKIFVASVSPQVRASLAATYGISERRAGYMIDQFLRGPQGLRTGGKHGNSFTWVIDTDVLRQLVLTLAAQEVTESLQTPSSAGNGTTKYSLPKKPILSSACPGWICYAEKTHPHVLPHLSRLKSPQALAGTFIKSILSRALGVSPSQIWHLAVMPCFDKKLEASREELTDAVWNTNDQSPVRDVDCVITSRELLMLASSRNISLPSLPFKSLPSALAPHFPDPTVDSFLFSGTQPLKQNSAYGTSGGYLYHILSYHQEKQPGSRIEVQRGRNSDVIEYSLISDSNQTIMKAARYYGFRNIQNLVRKMKPARASRLPGANRRGATAAGSSGSSGLDYAFVEVMACPGGCTNGGGQIRLDDAREANASLQNTSPDDTTVVTQKRSAYEQREWLTRVDETYFSADSDSESEPESAAIDKSLHDTENRAQNIIQHWINFTGVRLEDLVYTTFRKVESDVGKDKNVNDTTRVAELAGKIGGGW